MYGFTFICLCLSVTVLAQPGTYVGRSPTDPGINGIIPGRQWGRVGRPGGIIDSRNDCYFNEEPSYDRFEGIERCSYRNRRCNDPRAVCRISRGVTGTCCSPRRSIGGYCRDGLQGLGACYYQRDCRQFGRGYECQFTRRGAGRCCSRHRQGIRF